MAMPWSRPMNRCTRQPRITARSDTQERALCAAPSLAMLNIGEPGFAGRARRYCCRDAAADSVVLSRHRRRAIPDTRVNYRVHWLTLDGNGRDRTAALAQHLYFKIADYCTPRSRILEARARDDREGGNVQMMMLQEEARRLFIDSDTSGEGGELLLYFLLEAELGLPQVLCKMPLKTNSKMPIHGVDGVHAGLLKNGGLAVYWGESKLYADVQSAMTRGLAQEHRPVSPRRRDGRRAPRFGTRA